MLQCINYMKFQKQTHEHIDWASVWHINDIDLNINAYLVRHMDNLLAK